jgi:hypothetical protein
MCGMCLKYKYMYVFSVKEKLCVFLTYEAFDCTCIYNIHLCITVLLQKTFYVLCVSYIYFQPRGRRGHDRMVVGFTTTCIISAYHH